VKTSTPAPTAVRTEKDTFGPIDVPADRLWGAQTQRSLHHFAISGERMAPELIRALAQVKRASAYVNHALGLLDAAKTTAIVAAADEVIGGGHLQEFPLVVWQTGSGTQTNMNMNEVLANRASELLGGPRGEARLVHPNDEVNKSQSSNDVFPTAMHLAAVDALMHRLLPALHGLRTTLAAKAKAFDGIVKIGRAPTFRTPRPSHWARRSRAGWRSCSTVSSMCAPRCPTWGSWLWAAPLWAQGSMRLPVMRRPWQRSWPT